MVMAVIQVCLEVAVSSQFLQFGGFVVYGLSFTLVSSSSVIYWFANMNFKVQTCLLLLCILFFENVRSAKIGSVLVTGANRGLGLEFVRQFSQLEDAPDYIFATYRNESTLQELNKIQLSSKKAQVILIKLDVRFLEQIKAAKEQVEQVVGDRGLNLLINNAGVLEILEFPNLTFESMEFMFRTNTAAPVIVTQVFLPLLQAASRTSNLDGKSVSKAAVIGITSMTSSIQKTGAEFPQDLIVAGYKISKAGFNMAMRIMAAEVTNHDILVCNIEPGWVKTDMGTQDAPLEPSESIGAMIETFGKLDETDQGAFINRFGETFPF
ncbi:hypothetical protein JTE90_022393 [Oedothorax gibbosus]|uniref:Uncharacterized protein n=1 Tax=Oedothorax gibbosus TaxID=931172 RepID=A0AAV6U299_9ARAC|nr:hypothetical protein JTE90_022393 [Oedothorax gibbosus]